MRFRNGVSVKLLKILDETDPGEIAPSLHESLKSTAARFFIDDQTAFDLELEEYSRRYNTTLTSFGDEMFHHLLHSQPRSSDECVEMKNLLDHFSGNASSAAGIGRRLKRLGRQKRGSIVDDLWQGIGIRFRMARFIPIWFIGNPLLLVLPLLFFGTGALIPVTIPVLIADIIFFMRTNRQIFGISGSIHYLCRVIQFWKSIRKKNILPEPFQASIGRLCKINRYSLFFKEGIGGGQDPFSLLLDYIRVFLAAELFAFHRTYAVVNRCIDDIRLLIVMTGRLDVAVSTRMQLEARRDVCRSNVSERNDLEMKGMIHPLIDDCVPNDVSMKRGVIITGLNMSGKSTFLKALALNQILATSFHFAFAERFDTGYYQVISSLKIEDDILLKKSKYFMEAERLLYILKEAETAKVFCVIDEILTGTNNEDRVTASIRVLEKLAEYRHSIAVAATHDLLIAEKLSHLFDTHYFDGDIEEESLSFDYKIKGGIASKKNALLILRFLGFDLS